MNSVSFDLVPGQPAVDFRFTIKTTRDLERSAGMGIDRLALRGQTIEALVLLVYHGQRWNKKAMTEDKAVAQIQGFIESGGDTVVLYKALEKALKQSGVYGKPAADDPDESDGEETQENPTPATAAATTES